MQRRARFTFPTHEWPPTARIGGPLDEMLDELRTRHPGLWVERLKPTYPAADHNLYFVGTADLRHIIQLNTGPDGHPPFTIEADDRVETSDPTEALAAIEARIHPAG